MTNPDEALIVEQCDREAAASFYNAHLARPGEVPVAAAMRMRHIDDSPLIQAFARHRLSALKSQQARIKELEGALRPLVAKLNEAEASFGKAEEALGGPITEDDAVTVSIGELRKVRAALSTAKEGE